MSGVSLLAAKLKSHSQVWASQETVKLCDSVTVDQPLALENLTIDQFREKLASLIHQTNEQEKTLLKYHSEMNRIKEENDRLKIKLMQKISDKQRVFSAWRDLRNSDSALKTPEHHHSLNPMVHESVNLNETLRNLAQSLVSPFNDKYSAALKVHSESNLLDVSSSTVKSTLVVPFQTSRLQKHFPNH